MNYRLVVTTDGRPGLLERTLASHAENVAPAPGEIVVVDDSGELDEAHLAGYPGFAGRWRLARHPERCGFCATVAHAWQLAAEPGPDFVFWTEDDVVVPAPLDLRPLAAVLARERTVAQMSLMRQAWNEKEIAAGGIFNLYRDSYAPRDGWLLSRTNFSTTCSLMRREFMVENPFVYDDHSCEGRYSIDLLQRGYLFGVWGDGSPNVEHIGVTRVGKGY